MLTLPSVHPALMALLTDGQLDRKWLATLPPHTWERIIEDAIAQRVRPVLFHRLNRSAPRLRIPGHSREQLHQHIVQHTTWNLELIRK